MWLSCSLALSPFPIICLSSSAVSSAVTPVPFRRPSCRGKRLDFRGRRGGGGLWPMSLCLSKAALATRIQPRGQMSEVGA